MLPFHPSVEPPVNQNTVNVDICSLYIFSRYSRLSNLGENIYIVKITYLMPDRGSNIKNAKINLAEILKIFGKARTFKYAKISTFTVCRSVKSTQSIYIEVDRQLSKMCSNSIVIQL